MAAHTSLLLVIALCAATADSLECYTCHLESDNADCLTATNCSSGETYCLSVVASASLGAIKTVLISKLCSASCSPSSSGNNFASASVTCCDTDLCNISGSATIRSSCAAIILALGSVLIILKSSVL